MELSGAVKSFVVEKFWRPIVDESVFYNPFNTAVYSILFALAAAYIGYPLVKRMGLKFNREFFIGITPYIFVGGAMRSLKDINAVNTILLETPFIYLVAFVFIAGTIAFSRGVERYRGIEYHKTLAATGIIALTVLLSFYSINNMKGFTMIILLGLGWMLPGYLVLKSFRPDLLSYSFSLPVTAHYLDATVTTIALMFPGTSEKHVLGRFFVDLMGPAGMFVMKTLVIIPVVWYIDQNMEGEEKRYYLFLVALLGLAIATRNFLSFITLT